MAIYVDLSSLPELSSAFTGRALHQYTRWSLNVLVAEDGGEMRIVAILPNGELKTLMQLEGQDNSEITGPAFDPSGTRLYFSSQRGTSGLGIGGITYEITGPFHRLA